jgi:myo-inositol 2-dehydrogenase / D-chiro-inositol 1-dehydrogenase
VTPARVGVVGLGGIGVRHARLLRELAEAELVGVAELDGSRRESIAAELGAAPYADWRHLLESERLDALFVATPPATHADPTVAALDAGLHVFVEKPLARTAADAAAIVAAAERSGCVCAVGYQWRAIDFLPTVRELLAEQEPALVVGASLGPTRARPWFLDHQAGGGILLELATHDIDLHRAVAGEIVAVQAAASAVPLAQHGESAARIANAMSLTLHYENGGLGISNSAWTGDDTPEVYFLQIAATDATLRLDLDPDFVLSGVSRGKTFEPIPVAEHPSRRNIRHFLAAVREGGGEPLSTAADAARALTVALACERALESGETVPVPA